MQTASFGESDMTAETNTAALNAFFPKEFNSLIPTLSMLPNGEEVTMLEAEGLGGVTHTDPLFSMPPLAEASELVPDDNEEEEEEEVVDGEEDKDFGTRSGNMKRHVQGNQRNIRARTTRSKLTFSPTTTRHAPRREAAGAQQRLLEVMPRRHPLPTSVLAAAVEYSDMHSAGSKAHARSHGVQHSTHAEQQQQQQHDTYDDGGRREYVAPTRILHEHNTQTRETKTCGRNAGAALGRKKSTSSAGYSVALGPTPGTVVIKSESLTCGADGNVTQSEAVIDPKRARRIISNRQSAQRSKERKQEYLASLETEVSDLREKTVSLESKLQKADDEIRRLTAMHGDAVKRWEESERRLHTNESFSETLRQEVVHLREANRAMCAANGATVTAAAAKGLGEAHIAAARCSSPSHRRSGASMLSALGKALEQTAHFAADVGTIASPSLDAQPSSGSDWLADINFGATPPRPARVTSSYTGVKRKNTAPY